MENLFFGDTQREDIVRILTRIDRDGIPLWAGLADQYVMYEAQMYPVILVLSYLYREKQGEEELQEEFDKEIYAAFVRRLVDLGFVSAREDNFLSEDTQCLREPVAASGYPVSGRTPFLLPPFLTSLHQAGLQLDDRLVARFAASLLAKPFVILTGLSGSGKTRLAQLFAQWICEEESQICLVPVGADWSNREALLGYPNALEQGKYVLPDNGVLTLLMQANRPENRHRPYFLILDEMNLSHVERYFADFLSVMESGGSIPLHPAGGEWNGCPVPSSISFPDNLFVIGTVNVDETTYMFSPKVLDRAGVIEFRITEQQMAAYLNSREPLKPQRIRGAGAEMAASFVEQSAAQARIQPEEYTEVLLAFFRELQKTGAAFGYRTVAEIGRFVAMGRRLDPAWQTDDLIDAAVMQKVLPRLHGSRRQLEPVLRALGALCLREGENIEPCLSMGDGDKNLPEDTVRYPLTLHKIRRMYRAVMDHGFAGYSEA